MNLKTILVPTDFSPGSEVAIDYAASLAKGSNATLLIVHVVEPPPAVVDAGFAGYPLEDTEPEERQLLAKTRPTDDSVPVRQLLLHGSAASKLVETAEAENADLIVMGTHGRTGLLRTLMGSVAESVVRRSPCPVLTIKNPAHAPVEASD